MQGHTGFSTAPATDEIGWANDEFGNTPHTSLCGATDETGLTGYDFVKVNLDNNNPAVSDY